MNPTGYRPIELDDEVFYVASDDVLRAWPKGDDHFGELLYILARFVLAHDGFLFGYRIIGIRKRESWMCLYRSNTGLQRVHIEHPSCTKCNARFTTANPTVWTLYMLHPKEWELLRKAAAQPLLPCPVCGAKLEREAIWLEDYATTAATW
jgi:hypothetical protein